MTASADDPAAVLADVAGAVAVHLQLSGPDHLLSTRLLRGRLDEVHASEVGDASVATPDDESWADWWAECSSLRDLLWQATMHGNHAVPEALQQMISVAVGAHLPRFAGLLRRDLVRMAVALGGSGVAPTLAGADTGHAHSVSSMVELVERATHGRVATAWSPHGQLQRPWPVSRLWCASGPVDYDEMFDAVFHAGVRHETVVVEVAGTFDRHVLLPVELLETSEVVRGLDLTTRSAWWLSPHGNLTWSRN